MVLGGVPWQSLSTFGSGEDGFSNLRFTSQWFVTMLLCVPYYAAICDAGVQSMNVCKGFFLCVFGHGHLRTATWETYIYIFFFLASLPSARHAPPYASKNNRHSSAKSSLQTNSSPTSQETIFGIGIANLHLTSLLLVNTSLSGPHFGQETKEFCTISPATTPREAKAASRTLSTLSWTPVVNVQQQR